jgi:hypothetical protein
MLESDLEQIFRHAVRADLRGWTMKMVPAEKGAPDRIVCLPGSRMRLVELKTETGRLSPKQRHLHAKLAKLGTTVDVVVGRQGIVDWVAARLAEYN